MNKDKRIACVIPARLASTRFPEKVLSTIDGKPMLQWVYEAASNCRQFTDILFAVDAQKTMDLVHSFGAKAVMTSISCPSGTARLIEVWKQGLIQADIWVNWQADEPLIHEAMIADLLKNTEMGDVWTLKKKIHHEQDVGNPNIVKVVTDKNECALYFSRVPIPFSREGIKHHLYYKHVGIYAYSSQSLEKIEHFSLSELEDIEKLEQLTFLYHGLKVAVHETAFETIGIDLPEHIDLVLTQLK